MGIAGLAETPAHARLPPFIPILTGKIAFELPGCVLQIAPRDDVETLEHGSRLMAADGHGHALRYAAPDKVAHAGRPKIVEKNRH